MEWNDKLAAELLDFKRGFYSRGFPSEKVVEDFINSKQPKLDYEILSVSGDCEDCEDCWSCDKKMFDWYLKNGWKISQVKRLSDNEVFTIGDRVLLYENSPISSSITKFTLLQGFILATVRGLENNQYNLNLIYKSKDRQQQIFTPEQEMEIVSIIKETFKFLKK